MRSFNRLMFPERGDRQPEPNGKVYSRADAGARPRSAVARDISRHPVISILLRIDELKHRDAAGRGGVKRQSDQTLAELEACLAAIQNGPNY